MYIGLLEDEPDLAQHVREILEGAGHAVSTFSNGEDMVKAIGRDTIDLFVLDWRVPRLSGFEVLKHIRQVKSLQEPVLFLTSRSDELDITAALNEGADDYCVKPVRPKEFLARVAALLRRTYRDRNDEESVRTLLDYKFNKVANTVTFQNRTQPLSEKEFKLALFLFENAERAISRERLTHEVWGNDMQALSRTLDVHIAWIRKKLDLSATSMRLRLRPVHGYGYRLMTVHEGHPDD